MKLSSGYGNVSKHLLPRLADRYGKKNILILAPVFQQGYIGEWQGMTVLPGNGNPSQWGEEMVKQYWDLYKPTFVLHVGDWGHLRTLPELASSDQIRLLSWCPYDFLAVPDDVVQATLKSCWKVVPWTQYAYDKLAGHKLGNLTMPIPLGIDEKIWRPLDPRDFPDTMRSLGFEPDAFNILYIQANQRRKYLEEQLEGCALFRKAHPEIKMRIYMHTPQHGEADMGLVLHGLGLEDITRMQEAYTYATGGFPEEQLCVIMNCANVVMDALLEGMGLSQLQSQALNLPAITLAEGPGQEIVVYGAAVPSMQIDMSHIPTKPLPSPLGVAQALEAIWPLKGQRSEKARQHVLDHYTWDRVASAWYSLIEDTLLPELGKYSMILPEKPSARLLRRAKEIVRA